MSEKQFSFGDQLVVGSSGEEAFLQRYPDPLVLSLDMRWDFTRLKDGARVELKTDSYDMTKFGNFFFERYSDVERETPGGPWRAKKDRVDVFCYLFEKHDVYYEFTELKSLLAHVDKRIEQGAYKEFRVKNKGKGSGWVSLGYAVPREELKQFYTEYTLPEVKE